MSDYDHEKFRCQHVDQNGHRCQELTTIPCTSSCEYGRPLDDVAECEFFCKPHARERGHCIVCGCMSPGMTDVWGRCDDCRLHSDEEDEDDDEHWDEEARALEAGCEFDDDGIAY